MHVYMQKYAFIMNNYVNYVVLLLSCNLCVLVCNYE